MSRIQDILAKAERDGTARRTQSTAVSPPPASTHFAAQPLPPRVDGTAALGSTVSISIPVPSIVTPEPLRPQVAAARVETDVRTGVPTMHPFLVAAIEPHSEAAERYRSLRTRISHREESMPVRALMVTSPAARDGKSLTVANLALTMAQELQRRVVLVDADFRGSSIHSLFGFEGTPGLAEVLSGQATLEEALIYMPDHQLTILPAGEKPAFPTELLGSTSMRRTVDTLRGRFDRVLFDMPAVLPLADAGALAPMVDGVLIVVRAGSTQRPALDQALSAFDEQKLLGVVLNEVA
jgi:capsular exopolysaccharide synthesis family protein